MTVKVETYPEMSYHQRFPSSSNGTLKQTAGIALNGYAEPNYTSRPYHNSYRNPNLSRPDPHFPNGDSYDPHSSSYPDTLALGRDAPGPSTRLDHSVTYPDNLLTLPRNGAGGPPRGAPPAFVSATLSRGLRRADHPPRSDHPRSARNNAPHTVTYRTYSNGHSNGHSIGHSNGHSNGQPNGQANGVNLHRFPSQHHRIQASNTLQPPARRSSATNAPPVTNPQTVIWQVSPPNGAGGGGRPTVVMRKPRSRRLLRSLLCCFGAKPHSSAANGDRRDGAPLKPEPLPPSSPYLPKPSEKLLLPALRPADLNKKCLIIDLDETLVHSSFKPVKNADFVIPVEIDGVIHQVYVLKRPFVDEFLDRIGDLFECILFTASLAKIPVQSWFDDMSDTELLDLLPILERMVSVDNVYSVLRNANEHP